MGNECSSEWTEDDPSALADMLRSVREESPVEEASKTEEKSKSRVRFIVGNSRSLEEEEQQEGGGGSEKEEEDMTVCYDIARAL